MSIFREGLLSGKVAVVTGGGSGINLGIAERMAQLGAKTVLIGRTQEKLDNACAGIRSSGGEAMGLSADVRDFDAMVRVLKVAYEARGAFDILVCGAAGNFPARAADMSANGFKAVIDIDLLGSFHTCRAAYEYLRKPGASIVNISATQAFVPTAFQSHVCAAKAGVDMITRTLAIEWGPEGVRVNSIAPGPIAETEGMRRLAPTPETSSRLQSNIPLGRYGRKDEIGDLAIFLCSDAAEYITGAVMVCDGGQSLVGSGVWVEALGAGADMKKAGKGASQAITRRVGNE
ncbi:MAG TPA: SDR family oxidoreductase [Clostridia bacterium]|nr:SDR family oxidoreductase [Clostridia bacterium]